MGFYIPTNKRNQLLKYKYSSTDKSLTSKYILNPYWTWLVTLFPLSIAPNLITLLGLICVLINFATLIYFNPTLACGNKPLHISKGGVWDPLFAPIEATTYFKGWSAWFKLDDSPCAPQWLYFTFAIGLFIYQSLDAIDGKQARRTGTSGPLGELFDHGCDALNTTLEVILTASALNLGLNWWTVASLVATNANFYLTTWEEYHTGTLYLSAFSGPVEGILLIIVVFVVTGFQGPTFWDQGILTLSGLNSIPFIASLHLKDLPVNDMFLVFSTGGLFINVLTSTRNVYRSLPPSSRSILKPLSRLFPYLLHTTSMLLWLRAQPEILHTELLIPFTIFWGISFAHHVGLLILAHLTKDRFPIWWSHALLLLSILGSVDANWERIGGSGSKGWAHANHERVVWTVGVCVAVSIGVYAHFVIDVVGDICDFYNINCLTIKKKPMVSDEKLVNGTVKSS